MSTHLITGKAGYEHVKASDHGALHAAIMGGGEFVLEGGEQFACQVISNNKVRIFDGEALMQGRHIRIDRNTYEETTHDNGVQGYKRIDLVVLTYTKDEGTGVENVALEVIKGTPSESNPSVPSYVTGDILNNGELKNQMPLYKIPFDGLSIGEPVKMFETVPTMQTMKEEVNAKVDAKIAEMDDAFAELEGSIDDKIAEAGKPLSSNASDWGMIANYGEYSADAKTVGEEFAKVSDSLGGFEFKVENGKKQVSTDGGSTWENFSSGAELLWTNSAPTSNFSAQTISLDLSSYDHVIVYVRSKSNLTNDNMQVFPKDNTTYKMASFYEGYNAPYLRDITVSNNGVVFGSCTNANSTFPLAIYGICGEMNYTLTK